ncbi:MAG: plasmid stabilization protein [Rhizobiaceae bacterium]|nr:plasmid stabilization protein [Rhizobiaceae bacterium]
MASLTVRNIEDETKQGLRLRAARRGHSMEEEIRAVLREAAARQDEPSRNGNLYEDIRALVEPHGGFDIPIPARQLAARAIPFGDRDGDD